MLGRIVVCALLAGGLAGGLSALLQQALVVPVLMEAELYETGAVTHFAGPGAEAGHDHASHAHAPAPEGEEDGLGRHLVTAVMTIALNVGFALLLLAAFHARDARPSARQGLVWGTAGFAAIMLAPAAGLAPELPGVAAADLAARQLWWAGTVAATAAALWLIAFARAPWAVPVAVALIAAPHLIGAPHPEAPTGPAPPELAADFAARALAVGLASWAALGAAAAWAWGRFGPAPA